jgi:CHAT domain-containing protein
LSGAFPWAPARHTQSRQPCQEEADLEETAGQILSEADRTGSVDSLHAAGVARVLLGSFEEGLSRLERVSHLTPRNAEVWNDVAAARYARAVGDDDPQRLPSALSAVDRALLLSPSFPEARFNRALILTRLGMRNEAIPAWRSAQTAEHDHGWAAEANRRLSALLKTAASPIAPELERALRLAERGNSEPLRATVNGRPQETRTVAQTTMLETWAEDFAKRKYADAERALARTRRIGELLVATNGDRLVHDVVQAIDRATLERRQQIAKAHLIYRDADLHYRKRLQNSAAEFLLAAEIFAREQDPMEYAARYYGATAMLHSNHPEESRVALDRVLAAIDPARYPSLVGAAQKELGLYYGFRGMWTAALAHLQRSMTLFATRRERMNAAFVDAIVGEAYDRIGDFDRGWRHRISALDALTCSPPDERSVPVLIGAAHAEIIRADYESALALLKVAKQESERVRAPDLRAEMLLREAQVLLIARGDREAEGALMNAKRVTASIENDGTRGRIEAETAVVEAAILSRSNPRRAAEIVTPAILFFQRHRLGILLPPAYLERGRAYLGAGSFREARRDFEHGLRWIERQRASVAVDIRTTLFDTVPELTGELVALLLASAQQAEAYQVMERARARTLTEALGFNEEANSMGVRTIARALPPKAILIEYAVLPDDVAAFCIGPKGLTVLRLGVKPSELRRAIPELRTLIETRKPIADVRRAAARLYDELFLPLEPQIKGSPILYLAPDRFLNAMPFSALYDARDQRYLVQKHRLILTPSGTFLGRREPPSGAMRPALIIADPTSSQGGRRLEAARRNATEIANMFDARSPLVGPDATIERFMLQAPKHALIHYAGHAHSDDTSGGFLPLAPSEGSDGRVDATAISRLPLRRTNLVILSACATMRGDPSRIEGMPSLSRAFLTAGARGVIGMLWDVDDQPTARLLLPFYRHLRDGMPPSQALQEAQIEMLTNGREEFRHPANWAAAEFVGVDTAKNEHSVRLPHR